MTAANQTFLFDDLGPRRVQADFSGGTLSTDAGALLLRQVDMNLGLTAELARRVYRGNDLGPRSQCAFVVDDTSQARAGRKVQGTSCYFDHTEGRTRKGHQVLHLGLAGEKGFLPLEAQIVMGEKGRIDKPKDKPFRDQRSAAARDMRRAGEHSKHSLFRDMLRRAVRAGFRAAYVLGDAWFGCKENIACCLELELTALFQMKRGLLAYQYHGRPYTASQLYALVQRRMRPNNRRARYKTASLIVSLNLQTDDHQPARWVEVRLVFSAPVRTRSADTWVVFLCTDVKLSDAKILEVYTLRWSIEVYFKEINNPAARPQGMNQNSRSCTASGSCPCSRTYFSTTPQFPPSPTVPA
jgi:hypothetical protein